MSYDLPRDRIAQEPAAERDAARLLVTRRGRPDVRHAFVRDLPEMLPNKTLIVVNDTRVLPARLLGVRDATGGKAEVLLVRRRESHDARRERWTALLGTRGRPRPGETFTLGPLRAHAFTRRGPPGRTPDGKRHAATGAAAASPPDPPRIVSGKALDDAPLASQHHGEGVNGCLRATLVARLPEGEVLLDLATIDADDTLERALERGGAMPLPPYIRRKPAPADRERYQTVYAARPGAVAAPTAGLHFTPELLARLEREGHEVVRVTLHVGPGTFRPISADEPDRHVLEAEWAEVPAPAATAIASARRDGRTVLAVGTTVVRTLETAAAAGATTFAGDTALYILPGHRFRAVDALLTNFHLPRTTLLALVMAFHGIAPTRAAYAAAIREGYRFYSYGDAMLVLPEE